MARSNESWWSPDDDWSPIDHGPDNDPDASESGDEGDDPYGLFDSDLQAYIESESQAIDAAIFGPGESDEDGEEDFLDDSVEFGQPQVIRTLFDPPLDPPDDALLDDAALRREYDALIEQLARFNIRLDTCEHFSLRECYRYLVDVVLNEEAYPNLGGTDVDQFFMTHDDCPECSAANAADCGDDPASEEEEDDDDRLSDELELWDLFDDSDGVDPSCN